MNHSFYDLERHAEATIERITEDRTACEPIDPSTGSVAFENVRLRIGSLLIKLGERVGGPAVSTPQAPTPWPSDTPRFGF